MQKNLTGLDLDNLLNLIQLSCNNNNIGDLNLSNNPKLTNIDCSYNSMNGLNIANNNNTNISSNSIDATNNQLNCIVVDDEIYSNQTWMNSIDANAFFSNNCMSTSVSEETVYASEVNIFPNPATEMFAITLGEIYNSVVINIYNYTGALVYQESSNNSKQIRINPLKRSYSRKIKKSDNSTQKCKN